MHDECTWPTSGTYKTWRPLLDNLPRNNRFSATHNPMIQPSNNVEVVAGETNLCHCSVQHTPQSRLVSKQVVCRNPYSGPLAAESRSLVANDRIVARLLFNISSAEKYFRL